MYPANNVEVRGRTSSIEKNLSRDSSMSSTCSSVIYHERMANNGMVIDSNPPVESPAPSHRTKQEKVLCLRKATEAMNNIRPPNGNNEASSIQVEHARHAIQNELQLQPYDAASYNEDENIINIQLPYDPNTPTEPDLWSGNFHPISLHGSIEQIASDTKSIKDSLNFMAKYIANKKVNPKNANELKDFDGIDDSVWNFISAIYQSGWDSFYTDNKSKTLREKISAKFTPRIVSTTAQKTNKDTPKSVPISIDKVLLPPPLPAKSAKKVNVISKYFQNKKSSNENKNKDAPNSTKLYAQVSKSPANTVEVLKIKEAFPTLNTKKIDQVNNIVKEISRLKPKIQMTTKGPSRKQVIIPMSKDNIDAFMKNSSLHVANINRQLCNAKLEVLINYIQAEPLSITIITSKVSQQSDLLIIDQYIKNSNDVNALQVEELCLPKSKSYLKIIGIPFYPHANSQEHLTSSNIKLILKQNQIFDNILLASKPRVIKVSPKSDMSIVWINIWDVQSGSNAKMLINRCFNIGQYIATIRGANMNPGVLQCKNCWKWGHMMFSCRIQGSKCVKCNSSHKSENHREFRWCCKANDKINPLRLEMKKGELCPHSFKCLNCYGDHQADSNLCPFWRHRFNREWQQKKYIEIRENRSKSIRSEANVELQQ